MKILFVTDSAYLPNNFSSKLLHIHEMAEHFFELGWSPVVLSKKAGESESTFTPRYQVASFDDPLDHIPYMVLKDNIDLVAAFVENSNIIHAASMLPINSIVYLNDHKDIDAFKEINNPSLRYFARTAFIAGKLKQASNIDAEVWPSIVNLDNYKTTISPHFVTFVNPIDRRGIENFLEVAAMLPHIPFMVCESHSISPADWEVLNLKVKNLSNVVLKRRTLNFRDEVLSVTKIMFVPTQWGNGSRSTIEAQACGIPSIASSAAGLKDIIGLAGIVLNPDTSAQSWSKEIEQLYKDPTLWEKMSKEALNKSTANLSVYKKFVKNYEKTFLNIHDEKQNITKAKLDTLDTSDEAKIISLVKSLINSDFSAAIEICRSSLSQIKQSDQSDDEMKWHLKFAELLYHSKQFDAVLLQSAYLREVFPYQMSGWYLGAEAARVKKDWNLAAICCEKLLADFETKDNINWRSIYAESLLELGKYKECQTVCSFMREKYPNKSVGYWRAAICAERQKNWPLALQLWSDSINIFSNEFKPWWAASLGRVVKQVLLNPTQLPQDKATLAANKNKIQEEVIKRLDSINLLESKGEWSKVAKAWSELILQYPSERKAKWYCDLGLAYFELEQYDKALSEINDAIEEYPKWLGEFQSTAKLIHQKLLSKGYNKSYPAVIKKVPAKPENFPDNVILPALQGVANDYGFIKKQADEYAVKIQNDKNFDFPFISIIIPVYNRSTELSFVLAGLCHQNYPKDKFEVVIADDGSQEDIKTIIKKYKSKISISYCWQEDKGYRLAEARNLGIENAKHDNIVILDSDAIPCPDLLRNYAPYFMSSRRIAMFGFRHYVLLKDVDPNDFLKDPDIVYQADKIKSENDVATSVNTDGTSVDWREEHVRSTNNLIDEKLPYRFLVGANCAFTREIYDAAGGYCNDFNNWGYEDQEYGYRLWTNGCYFIPVWDSYVYHQEPLEGKNDTDRKLGQSVTKSMYIQKCPFIYRNKSNIAGPFEAPLVSIYIPCYNREKYIIESVESALGQTVDDLEVCICDDGSTDKSVELIRKYYGNNPRVKLVAKENGGIGSASNSAVRLTRGCYVGQLDADDVLKIDAVEKCLNLMNKDDSLSLVYGTTDYINEHSEFLSEGWNWPMFSREYLLTQMIVHHFRLFRRRDWCRTSGFDETIANAVDYDMMLKLAEVGNVAHINRVLYSYRKHSESTTVQGNSLQTLNNFKVIQESCDRLGVNKKVVWSGNSNNPRHVLFKD